MFAIFKRILGAFSNNHANCLACDQSYAKDAMREIWYRYTDDDVERTSAVYLCEPCATAITANVEDAILDDNFELEIDIGERDEL